MKLENTSRKKLAHILFIMVIGFVSYSNTFHSPFYVDDTIYITENPIIKDLRHFLEPSAVKEYVILGGQNYSQLKMRYIGLLTFALNYRINGDNVTGYHIVNLAIHLTNAVILYLLILSCIGVLRRDFQTSSTVPFLVAMLFVSHPIQTQAVTYLTQRFVLLACMFYLLCLLSYVKSRLASSSLRKSFYYVGALVFAILAMKTKEIAFTLPITLALYEIMFLNGKPKRRALYLSPFFLTMLSIPLSLINFNSSIVDILKGVEDSTHVLSNLSRWDYLITQFTVVVTYIRLLFLPVNQNFDYDYPTYHSLFYPQVFFSLILLLLILVTGLYLNYRNKRNDPFIKLIAFGIFWFFITLSVESSLIPIGDVIFEHRVYLPSAGFFMVVVPSAFLLKEKLTDKIPMLQKAIIPSLVFLICILSVMTFKRNEVWQDETRFWEDVVSKSPGKARPHYSLGLPYRMHGRLDEAVEQYQIASCLDPHFIDVHNALGIVYGEQRRYDDAIREYRAELQNYPQNFNAHENLAMVYFKQGRFKDASDEYQTAQTLRMTYTPGPEP